MVSLVGGTLKRDPNVSGEELDSNERNRLLQRFL